ncbi:MAG: extracellular solute-binding protein, partial [Gammaproteobacteria bacterium]|nr:extracellular solute-binding protein [Gammaproteobacteria bacterium]
MKFSAIIGLVITIFGTTNCDVVVAAPSQALGYEVKYKQGFAHFDYVNPDAPKGGDLNLSSVGNFDSLNPYILKGISAEGLSGLMFETLMTPSLDEPFSQYGLLAIDAQLAADKLSVTFTINPKARFYDGSRVTAEDVKFSFDTLKSDKAHPQYRYYWADITQVVMVDDSVVRFEFAKVNPELHLIAGQIPIFSRHWVKDGAFDKLSQVEPLTSGPYRIESYDLGKQISYVRNRDYWARDLPVRRGMYNFDRITYKYYRDATVALEAFKAGEYEFNHEYNSKKWATDYTGPRFDSGEIVINTLPHKNNAGMQGFIFNIRKELFKDQRVRRAITLALDFDWSNRKLFYNQYQRCDSYFSNSELASTGLPEGEELKLLEPYREQLPERIFSSEWRPPTTKKPATLRNNLREANRLLKEAGWQVKNGLLTNGAGERFSFDVMLAQKGFERIMAPFARNLKKLGISVDYRTVDVALYQQRVDSFDFDMVVSGFGQSQSPGNELKGMFHSSSAGQNGSRNLIGISDPVVDAMIDKVIYANSRAELVTAVHALDRVLLHGDYLVPHWYIAS